MYLPKSRVQKGMGKPTNRLIQHTSHAMQQLRGHLADQLMMSDDM